MQHPPPDTLASLERASTAESALRVLVVEDDPELAHILTVTFARCGAQALHARTASEALAFCLDHHPDLLVLDLLWPTATATRSSIASGSTTACG